MGNFPSRWGLVVLAADPTVKIKSTNNKVVQANKFRRSPLALVLLTSAVLLPSALGLFF